MRKIPCHCENTIENDFPEEIDLAVSPEYYDRILDGSFQEVTCDNCGAVLKPELEMRLRDAAKGLDLYYAPEVERKEYLLGKNECPAPRLVIGFPELLEKIKLYREGINDGALEVLKYYLKKKAASDEITILFDHRDGEHLIFHIQGLKPDQIAVTPIPVSVYNSTLQAMKQNPDSELYRLILTPPYISSNKISVLEDEQ